MSKFLFKCATKWHEPNNDFPGDQLIMNTGMVYNGYVCRHCGCVYFEHGGKKVHVSEILSPQGEEIIVQ